MEPISNKKYQPCIYCQKQFTPRRKGQVYCERKCYDTWYNNHCRDNQKHVVNEQTKCIELLEYLSEGRTCFTVDLQRLENAHFRYDYYSRREESAPFSQVYFTWYGPFRTNITNDYQLKIVRTNE